MTQRERILELETQVALLTARLNLLALDTEQRAAEFVKLVSQPSNWIALKAAPRGPFTYETLRRWCEIGLIEATKERGRWFLNEASLSARLARLGAK